MALAFVPSVLVRALNKMDRISRLLNRIDKIEQDRHDNPPLAGEVLWAQPYNHFVAHASLLAAAPKEQARHREVSRMGRIRSKQ